MKKIGFDNEKYLQMQSAHIRERIAQFGGKLYLEFGGKLVVEDVKSKPTRTKEYLRNRKFMRSKFGIDIQEI